MTGAGRVIIASLVALLSSAASNEPKELYYWVDVSISASGAVEQAMVADPPLSRGLAAPIEKAIASLTFTPGTVDGQSVPRTTSVFVVLRLVTKPDGGNQIEFEKLEEGPRILRRSNNSCLKTFRGTSPAATFTVTPEGRAIDVASPDPDSAIEKCAIQVLQDTVFKPDTVNGKPVSTKVSRRLRLE